MFFPHHRTLLLAAVWALLGAGGLVRAHVVPNMTVEVDFTADGGYGMTINVDPRTFMAADPTTLPPVPGSWYRDQTPAQVLATHQKAREYLIKSLGLVFGGEKKPLPECVFQAIDGNDNTPISADTQEVHLLATTRGTVPGGATSFQVDFAKEANTSLILLSTQPGNASQRARVVFPGEISPALALGAVPSGPSPPTAVPPADSANSVWLFLVGALALILVIIGWRLLGYYRHHHRFHRKPRTM